MIIATTRKIVGDTRSFCADWSAIPAGKYDPTKLSVNQYAYSEKDVPSDFYKKHVIYYVDYNDSNRLVKAYEYEDKIDQITFITGDIIGVAGTITNDKFMQYLADIIAKLADRVTDLEDKYASIMLQLSNIQEYLSSHQWSDTPVTPGDDTEDDEDTLFLKDLAEIDEEYFNFTTVYNNALGGVSNVPVSDTYQFVSIFDDAYMDNIQEKYVNDGYLLVQAYLDAFGGWTDLDDLLLLFGSGPFTFEETYDTALSTGLTNLPGYNSTLPTIITENIDWRTTTFKQVYDTAVGSVVSTLPSTEDPATPIDTDKTFDTIYNESLGVAANDLP